MDTGIEVNLDFLRFCINPSLTLPEDVQSIDWKILLVWAEQQAIVGVVFEGLKRLGDKGMKLPFELIMEWLGTSEQIKRQNRLLNGCCVELVDYLGKDGFECCVLKGQGNAMMYPDPYSRTPGDIDVWVRTKPYDRGKKDDIRNIINYARQRNPKGIANSIHVDYGVFNGVDVELHYWPTYMNSPIYNKRLCRWVSQHRKSVFDNKVTLPDGTGEICVPTYEFNLIYQMSHMYKHVISEGIGLRQMIDYYYLLKSGNQVQGLRYKVHGSTESLEGTLKYFGLWKFAGAVMYVLHNVMGLDEKYLIVAVDEKRGRFLLEEILRGGNFGKYNTKKALMMWDNPVGSWIRHLEHDLRLIRYFPSESLWEPFSRIYQHFWRKRYN